MTADSIVAASAANETNADQLSQVLDELHETRAMLMGAHAILVELDDCNEQAYASCLVNMVQQRLSKVYDDVDTLMVAVRGEALHG